MLRSERLLTSVSLCLAFAGSASEGAAALDPIHLQTQFGRADDLRLINRVADIPPDGQRKLEHFAGPVIGRGRRLADLGMDWSSSDSIQEHLSWGQHRFSAASSSLLAIVFVTGGQSIHYRVILAPRDSNEYCLFEIQPLGDQYITLSTVQLELRPDRDQTISRTPQCHRASVADPN